VIDMVKLTALTLALLFVFYSTSQEPKIVTCTVVEVDRSVACPEGGGMVLFTFEDPTAKKKFDKWRLVAPLQGESVNGDAPLYSKTLNVGDKVKAIITDTEFNEVTECHVRVWERIKAWQGPGGRPGERPPTGLQTLPDDCQPWYGKN